MRSIENFGSHTIRTVGSLLLGLTLNNCAPNLAALPNSKALSKVAALDPELANEQQKAKDMIDFLLTHQGRVENDTYLEITFCSQGELASTSVGLEIQSLLEKDVPKITFEKCGPIEPLAEPDIHWVVYETEPCLDDNCVICLVISADKDSITCSGIGNLYHRELAATEDSLKALEDKYQQQFLPSISISSNKIAPSSNNFQALFQNQGIIRHGDNLTSTVCLQATENSTESLIDKAFEQICPQDPSAKAEVKVIKEISQNEIICAQIEFSNLLCY